MHTQWIINGLLNDDIVLQDNSDYVLILRMIQLGLNSWSMMDTATFKEKKVSLIAKPLKFVTIAVRLGYLLT